MLSYDNRIAWGKILVLSRKSAVTFQHNNPWVAISINDPHSEKPEICDSNRKDLLHLEFDDAEWKHHESIVLFTDEQATQIWDFVHEHWSKVDLLMIHCFAGVSRSQAVAKAITQEYQPFDGEYVEYIDDLYIPNPLVYEIMKRNA